MVTKVSWSAVRVRRRELAGYTTAQCMGSEEAAGDGDPDTESNVYVIQPYKYFRKGAMVIQPTWGNRQADASSLMA
jgi:hypothetical protein